MRKPRYIINAMGMHSSKYGGLEKFIVRLAQVLSNDGIYFIALYNSKPSSEEFIKDLTQYGGKLVYTNAMHPLTYLLSYIKLFIKYRPSLVHAHFQLYYSVLYAKLLGCRHIFSSIHDLTYDKNLCQIQSVKQIKLSTRIFRGIINRSSNKFFCVSDAVKVQYSVLFPRTSEKLVTLYLGTAQNDKMPGHTVIRPTLYKDKIVIGTIGFNSPVKGLDILLESMLLLINMYKCTNFMVCQIGIDINDPESLALCALAKEKGLDDYIDWIGITNSVPELLHNMDIYCQPSRSEALSLSIMEAGMAGLPIVGSRVGGIPEIIIDGYNGYLFENGNANQLAECLYNLIINADLRRQIGANSRDYMLANFNIQTQVEKMSVEYLKVLD